ncbi:hypothetical protein M758_1G329500 [Ceratodon purpureus]|uniref:Hydroxyproline O-arabinosyltransferase-like domain-containing protein n=1 Tax=Ceratodon purpureus TaxID=3225 RepID=A0A8T0JC98_CERPU|nr:hypothetical protein KC19_1G337000 [Ceratodon purpureus]KAG0632448.1 hypothetical protein M758_1G329500 [Ceratodon purpureus]
MAALRSNCELLQYVFLWSVLSLWALASVAFRVAVAKSIVKDFPDLSDGTLKSPWRMHTLFSVECHMYFDWQTVGIMHSFRKSGQPGPVTRLLSCTDEQLEGYRGMDLAPTVKVPSMSQHPVTGDWYPAINKPAGVVHWLEHSKDAKNVDWVLILDADQIIRHPITPWALGAEKGKPVAARYGYLIGCDNELAKLHTKHPDLCDKVGGFIMMHIEDLRKFAPLWLSKTEEVRNDREHWATNITGDIYGKGWISEMYGYSFGAAEVGLRHKIDDEVMIYPGYIPIPGVEPLLMHYGLPFKVGEWEFAKLDHHEDDLVHECNRLFPAPPYPHEVEKMQRERNQLRGDLLSIECINTINEGLVIHHEEHACPKMEETGYIKFLKKSALEEAYRLPQEDRQPTQLYYPRIHTLFSAECTPYFDWQTVGLVHSFKQSKQPGYITRLLSCTEENLKIYRGMNLAPTHIVPSMSLHPLTGDWYPAINKPAAILHWLNHVQTDAEFIIILDADMIMRGPITPWEFGGEKDLVVAAPYDYLIGCDNILAQLHTRNPKACSKVGGVLIIHIDDLRRLAPFWLHKTEEVRADKAHWATNITGDMYQQGWISEMYGYAFGAAEINLKHKRRSDIMMYPGYEPNTPPRLLHYGLKFSVGNWHFDKQEWREQDMTNNCWQRFPEPPDQSSLPKSLSALEFDRDSISIECVRTLNEALHLHHVKRGCREPPAQELLKASRDEIKIKGQTESEGEHLRNVKASRLNSMKMMLKDRSEAMRSIPILINPKFWMVGVWTLLVSFFLLIVTTLFSRNKASLQRQRKARSHRCSRSGGEVTTFLSGVQCLESV